MTLQKTITIEVSMFSEASEAALQDHFRMFIEELKSKCEAMKWHSWHKSIHFSHDESYPVEIDVEASVK